MKEITWTATEEDAVLFDRRSSEAWLTATLAVDRGETR